MKNGKYVVYVDLLKYLYGLLKEAIILYKKIVKVLKKIVFKLNPYEPCVMNRTVNDIQHTIAWHVYGVNSFHVNPKVNGEFIECTRENYKEKETAILNVARFYHTRKNPVWYD